MKLIEWKPFVHFFFGFIPIHELGLDPLAMRMCQIRYLDTLV